MSGFNYQFSVGTITIGSNSMGVVTEIAVSYDGSPQEFYGGDYRLPLAIELGNRKGEITCNMARFSTSDDILDNSYVNVVLGTGKNGGGLTGTINDCKITSYNVKSSQDAFVASDIRLAITSQQASGAKKGGTWPAWTSGASST
jgi:hypothetical protein